MKSSKNTITTLSTLQASKTQISSSKYIIPSAFQVNSPMNQRRNQQRTISIFEQNVSHKVEKNKTFQRTKNTERFKTYEKELLKENQFGSSKLASIVRVLEKVLTKKKRYTFQVLKQFILFPDETQSSISSLSTYDPLIFKDEIVHSLFKIVETKVISNKIWAFINLRMMPYLKAAKKIEEQVTKVYEKHVRIQKKVSFDMIKKASDQAVSAIMKESKSFQINSYVETDSKEVQCGIEEKKPKRISLTSNLVNEQLRPIKPVMESPPTTHYHSSARIYTRQQYQQKLNKQNRQYPQIIRLSSPQPIKHNVISSSQSRTQFSSEYRSSIPDTKQERIVQKDRVSKYNIIHYHERAREIYHFAREERSRYEKCCVLQKDCAECSCHTLSCCCVCLECQICEKNSSVRKNKSNCCGAQFVKKADRINETAYTENFSYHQKKLSFIKSQIQAPPKELSDLESRIEYLNFLRSLVKEQEQQGSL